jgi:acyl-coenzyme A thioesterase PaaI-like protein
MVNSLKIWWSRLSRFGRCGKWLFSKFIGLFIPYTGSACPLVVDVGPGFAEVMLKDRRKIRNHLGSIHALALANVGELTTGLAVHFALEPQKRAILTSLNVNFLRKARGTITAKAMVDTLLIDQEGPVKVEAILRDSEGNVVVTVLATWLLGKIR